MILTSRNIPSIITLLRKAGREILSVYNSKNFGTKIKEDQSPVTIADLAADEIIKKGLLKITPSIPVFSEETKDVPFEVRSLWNPLWILDPLDGTKEFIAMNGEFCISLALISDNKPVAGFIYAPVANEFWYAIKGAGAFKIVVGSHIKLPLNKRDGPYLIIISRSHFNQKEQSWIDKFTATNGAETKIQGSAIKFCRIAEGNADLYLKFGLINEWDVAAGDLIISEAGGEMIELSSESSPVYNKRDYLQPHFISCGPRLKGSKNIKGIIQF
jgi:3'(2'), 5'-bisphosphate nucleotidase